MPFVDERRSVQPLQNIAGAEEPMADPSLTETFGAAFRTQNVVGSYLTSRGQPDPYQIEQDFDAIDYVKDDPKFAPYVTEFAGIFNKPAAEAKKQQILKEQQDRRTLDAAGGLGTIAEMAAGIVDLPTLLPVGGGLMAGARGVGGLAVATGIGAGIDAGISEAALQSTQATRTGEETALNIGGSIVLGGALGALVGRYLTPAQAGELSRKIEREPAEIDVVNSEFASMGRNSSIGAAQRDSGPLALKDEAFIKRLPGINRQDPLIRLQLSEMNEARGVVRGLAETPLEYAENASGIATELGGSVETRMKLWNAPLSETLENIDTLYARYYHDTPDVSAIQRRLSPSLSEFDRWRGRSDRMTYREFKAEVSKAAFSGEQHPVPQVAAAAAEYRKIDDMMKTRAIEAGLFPEDIAVKGDVSHLFRMYNREKIVAQRNDFARILQDYFVTKRDELARSQQGSGDNVRLYRGEGPITGTPFTPGSSTTGRYFATNRADAERFARENGGEVYVIDVPRSRMNELISDAQRPDQWFIVSERLAGEKKRLADVEKAAKGADATARRAAEKADEFSRLTDAEISGIVDETINTIIGNGSGRLPYDSIVSGPRGPLKERLLQIESSKIQDFLELDIEQILRAQVRTMSADVEIARKFGTVDMAEQIRKINDEADARIRAATKPKERQRLEAARKQAIRDVEGIRDRLRGQYALPDNPDGIVLRAGRVIRNINYLRMLGGMTISAIPDLAKPVFTYGLTSTFKDGFLPLVRNYRGFRLAADEVKAAGTALDMVLDSRVMALADITDDFGRHSKFERGLSSLSNRFGLVSLMAPWNASIKQFTGMITMTNILQATQKVANGSATPKEITALAASNIDDDMAKRIAKQFSQYGDRQSGVLLAKAGDWDDAAAREAFRVAVVRDVDRVVVTPGQDKPLWMSTELGKTIGQFKSFSVSSIQRTTLAGLQQRDAATLNGTMLLLALGALTYKLKMDSAGKETSEDPAVWAVEAFDRSGLSGWLMEVNNVSEKVTRGTVGLSAITGKQVSRYASRNATASLLGPTLGTVQDILDVSGSAISGEFQKSDVRKLRQLIPAQNLFYLRSLFNTVENSASEGLPGK